MEEAEQKVISSYLNDKLSEKQTAELFSMSPNRVRRILDRHHILRRSKSEAIRYHHITKFNQKEFVPKLNLTNEEESLKVAGIMLYWGEGTKNRGTVALSNSDPKMIEIFMRFLRVICGISEERVHATLHYYEDQNPTELLNFWASVIRVPKEQFYKPFLHKKSAKGSYRNPSKYGTISIQYSDSELFNLILKWMKEYSTLGSTSSL